jgi:hypothetical protein
LAKYLCRDLVVVIREDATGIDYAEGTATPLRLPVKAITSNSGFVPDDSSTRSDQAVE